jgi:hypothetical protein
MTGTMGKPWAIILAWGFILVAVLMVGAMIELAGVSGTCMFVLVPAFAAMAATYPILRVGRFGTGVLTYLPYAVIGFVPLLLFDWLQDHSLRGLWAVFVWTVSSPLIGLCADLAFAAAGRMRTRARAAITGATVQAATFVVMLLGLTYLYVDPTAADSHLRLFDTWYWFTLPWMVANGAFGGFAAHELARETGARGT